MVHTHREVSDEVRDYPHQFKVEHMSTGFLEIMTVHFHRGELSILLEILSRSGKHFGSKTDSIDSVSYTHLTLPTIYSV